MQIKTKESRISRQKIKLKYKLNSLRRNSLWRNNAAEDSGRLYRFRLCCGTYIDQVYKRQCYTTVIFSHNFRLQSSLYFFNLRLEIFRWFILKQVLKRDNYEHAHYGNFKGFFNYALNISNRLASLNVKNFAECSLECIINAACYSFNIAIWSLRNSNSFACHLLASDKYNHSSKFVPSQEFHHYAFVVSFNSQCLAMLFELQSTSDNSNLQGKSKKGSSYREFEENSRE